MREDLKRYPPSAAELCRVKAMRANRVPWKEICRRLQHSKAMILQGLKKEQEAKPSNLENEAK